MLSYPENHILWIRIFVDQNQKKRCVVKLEDKASSEIFESEVTKELEVLTKNQLSDIQWILEDFPLVSSPRANKIAQRINGDIHLIGKRLGMWLFSGSGHRDSILSALSDHGVVSGLRVIVSEAPGENWMPWELMTLPGMGIPLALKCAVFCRSPFFNDAVVSRDLHFSGPIDNRDLVRVLIVIARPLADKDVPFRSVASRVLKAFSGRSDVNVRISVLRPPTFGSLKEELMTAKKDGVPYNVVHFDGHGVYRTGAFSAQLKGFLCFEAEQPALQEDIDGVTMGKLLVESGVQLFLMNACRSGYSEASSDVEGVEKNVVFNSLAEEMISTGLQNILAMGVNVFVATAAHIVATTFAALACGRTLGEAVTLARLRRYERIEEGASNEHDWLVPICFEKSPVRFGPYGEKVPVVDIEVNTATEPNQWTLGKTNAPSQLFIGFDEVLLELDRSFLDTLCVELVGVAGSGKSTVSVEFARWISATGGYPTQKVSSAIYEAKVDSETLAGEPPRANSFPSPVSLVYDLEEFRCFEELEIFILNQICEFLGLRDAAKYDAESIFSFFSGKSLLWVFDHVSSVTTETSPGDLWPPEDIKKFREYVLNLNKFNSRVLLVGRSPFWAESSSKVFINGLSVSARTELACFEAERIRMVPSLQAFLDWTEGNPTLVLAIKELLLEEKFLDIEDAQKLIANFRSPTDEVASILDEWSERSRVEVFNAPIQRLELPILMGMFHGNLTQHDWSVFFGVSDSIGLSFSEEDEPVCLTEILDRAEFLGLALNSNEKSSSDAQYFIHPLAPYCFSGALGGVFAAFEEDKAIATFSAITRASCMTVIFSVQLEKNVFQSNREKLLGQNFWHVLDFSINHRIWDWILPLVRVGVDYLVAVGRDVDLRALLNRIVSKATEDDLTTGIASEVFLVMADEYDRLEDWGMAKKIRESALAFVGDAASFAELARSGLEEHAETAAKTSVDINRNRIVRNLIEKGDALRLKNSPDCLNYYNEAYELTKENADKIRRVSCELALAKSHNSVPELKDFLSYEKFARKAAATAASLGALAESDLTEAKLAIGNAIFMQAQECEESLTDERKIEAIRSLGYAANSDAAPNGVKAAAYNGLGLFEGFLGNLQSAGEYYLKACSLFQGEGQLRGLVCAQINASNVFLQVGKLEDTMEIAQSTLSLLKRNPEVSLEFESTSKAIYADAVSLKAEAASNSSDAVEILSQGLEVVVDHAQLLLLRGKRYYEEDNLEESLRDLEQALLIQPEVAEAYFARAQVRCDLGNWKQALTDLDQAIDLGYDLLEIERYRERIKRRQCES